MATTIVSFRLENDALEALRRAGNGDEESENLIAKRLLLEALGLTVGEEVKQDIESLVNEAVRSQLAIFRDEVNRRLGELNA